MIIYYPTHYLVPVVPILSLDDDDYRVDYNEESIARYNMGDYEESKTYRNMNEDIFYEVDQEYVKKVLNNNI